MFLPILVPFCQILPYLQSDGSLVSPSNHYFSLKNAPILTLTKLSVSLKQRTRSYIYRIKITEVGPHVYTLKSSFILRFSRYPCYIKETNVSSAYVKRLLSYDIR